jgi:hypothetical protein
LLSSLKEASLNIKKLALWNVFLMTELVFMALNSSALVVIFPCYYIVTPKDKFKRFPCAEPFSCDKEFCETLTHKK